MGIINKIMRMKNILIIISCLFIYTNSIFAEESIPAKKLQSNVAEENLKSKPKTNEKSSADNVSKVPPPNYIILNFDNAALKDVINTVASITNENFIITPGVDARITIHSSKKIPVSEVMNVFESVLEVNGMAIVRSGDFFKIVSGTTAKQKPTPIHKGIQPDDVENIDRPITQIVPVQYVPASEISTVLTPLLSQFGSITSNPRNNLLIINDLSSSIKRLLEIMREIDVNVFENTRLFFFKPKYSDVLTLSNELTEVLTALNLTGEGIALVPIERINSLIVFSSSPTLLKTVEGWIKKLDEEVVTGQNIFVYPVQNVKAQDIADILTTLYEGEDSSKRRVTPQRAQAGAKDSKRKRPATTRRTNSKQAGTGGRIEIIPFEPTNSLVIYAPPGIYRQMVETILKIDSYPREVLIEAIVAEVTLADSDKFGIQWSVLHNLNIENKNFTGLAQGNSGSENFPVLESIAPSLVSGPSGGLSYIIFRPEKLIAMFNALSSRSKIKILQSPSILVRDQEEASIEVGSDVPTATSTTSTTTTDTLTQSIEYRTVGIKLKIKPTISEEKTVVLDLEQEVSAQGDSVQVGREGNLFPSFTTTKTKTSIVVPNEQGIVIGGIMEETKNKGYQGIPLLSSIPILGNMFRYSVDTVAKKELIIFVTPHVVVSETEADKLTKNYLKNLRELKMHFEEVKDQIPLH
jgi:general secretion pathway protein D